MEMLIVLFFYIIDVIESLIPSVNIQSGIILLLLSITTIYLFTKLIEKQVVLKGAFLLILISSFFALVTKIEITDNIAVYTTALELGLSILLIMAVFISWDEDGEEYI